MKNISVSIYKARGVCCTTKQVKSRVSGLLKVENGGFVHLVSTKNHLVDKAPFTAFSKVSTAFVSMASVSWT